MDAHRFDAIARRLGLAASRRQALAALFAGAVSPVAAHLTSDEAAAGCKGYKKKCEKNRQCCKKDGLRCKRNRCRCKKGWKRCPGTGEDCTHVKADPDNCGTCGNECPPATPCCINGSCQEECGGNCCADCFVDKNKGVEQFGTDTCCDPGAGTFCRGKKNDPSDDQCCWPEQTCVKGTCCYDGTHGAVICGGKCCAEASCCNGQCCPEGQVCEMTPEGLACAPANRTCNNPGQCLEHEDCVDGTCCSADRQCGGKCCSAGQWCDDQPDDGSPQCCEINTNCEGTWRGHRVRR